MRNIAFGIGLILVVVAIAIPPCVAVVMRPPTGYQAYDQIRVGMTQAEVEAVVGMPPGYYRRTLEVSLEFGKKVREDGLSSEHLGDSEHRHLLGITLRRWMWDDFWLFVGFDKEGRVVGYHLVEPLGHEQPPPPTFLDRLRTLLPL